MPMPQENPNSKEFNINRVTIDYYQIKVAINEFQKVQDWVNKDPNLVDIRNKANEIMLSLEQLKTDYEDNQSIDKRTYDKLIDDTARFAKTAIDLIGIQPVDILKVGAKLLIDAVADDLKENHSC